MAFFRSNTFPKSKAAFLGVSLLAVIGVPARASDADLLNYTARLHGVSLLDISICLRFDDISYSAAVRARTVGLAEMLVHGRSEGRVDGAVDGTHLKPRAYSEHSRLSGEDYAIAITYSEDVPKLQLSVPEQTKYRLPVPAADLPGAVDGLSALALEVLGVTRSDTCDGGAIVFDGRQLRRATTHPAGKETLKASPHSVFSGSALRCNTTSVLLAGFLKSDGVKAQSRPRQSSVWLAPVRTGGPDVPVKVTFDADLLGDIIVDLDGDTHKAAQFCESALEDGSTH